MALGRRPGLPRQDGPRLLDPRRAWCDSCPIRLEMAPSCRRGRRRPASAPRVGDLALGRIRGRSGPADRGDGRRLLLAGAPGRVPSAGLRTGSHGSFGTRVAASGHPRSLGSALRSGAAGRVGDSLRWPEVAAGAEPRAASTRSPIRPGRDLARTARRSALVSLARRPGLVDRAIRTRASRLPTSRTDLGRRDGDPFPPLQGAPGSKLVRCLRRGDRGAAAPPCPSRTVARGRDRGPSGEPRRGRGAARGRRAEDRGLGFFVA